METNGEGEGGGAGEAERRGSRELGRLLEAIGSSEVLEKRIPLVKQLEEEFSADDLGLILQCLHASWTDSTCSGVSHCTLHRSILQVALKFSDLDITHHLRKFLTLGSKASSWSGKHLRCSAKCIDQSQVLQEEEHNRLCQEVNSLSLRISAKLLDIAAKCIAEPVEEGEGAAQEECALNMADDAFPTLETMVMEVGPVPAHLAVGVSPDPEASRQCTHCSSEKTSRWRPGQDGSGTLCTACWQKGQLLHSNPRRRRGRPSITGRRCMHCASEKTPNWLRGPDGPGTLCSACGQRFRKGRLLHFNPLHRRGRPSIKGRRCMHCGSEKTSSWLRGPDGPATLCNACGKRFLRGRLIQADRPTMLHPDACRRRGRPSNKHRSSSNDVAALAEALPCDVGASLDAFFDHTGLEVPWGEAGAERADEEEEELEWLSNKDAFPSVDTMAVEVEEEASALDVPQARTKGRRRVTAMETTRRQANMRAEKETVRRCTHCATEKTPQWRRDGLCNACGLAFGKKKRQLPEYLPANRPAFSPLLYSNVYCCPPEMHRQNEISATDEMQVELMDPPANSPTSSPLKRYSSLRRVLDLEEEISAAGRVAADEASRREESMEVQLLPERPPPPVDNPAFSLVSHSRVLKRRRKSEAQTLARIRATAKTGRADRAAKRLAAMDNL